MAEWTILAVLVGAMGLLVSGFGLAFLYWNIKLLRKQISETRAIGEKQIKAYLSCVSASCRIYRLKSERSDNEVVVHFYLEIKNAGQSPARLPGVSITGRLGTESGVGLAFGSKLLGFDDISANSEERFDVVARFEDIGAAEELIGTLEALPNHMIFAGVALYGIDVFARPLDDEDTFFWSGPNFEEIDISSRIKLMRANLQSEWSGGKTRLRKLIEQNQSHDR